MTLIRKTYSRLMMAALMVPVLSFGAFKYFDPQNPPAKLSATGLYSNMANKATLDTAAKAFEVNSALWSDGAVKKRWVLLPAGKHIQWVDGIDLFNYPDSTVFVKTFLQVMGPATTDTVYWETRLLLKKNDPAEGAQNWWGFSYRWNAAQTEANLVDLSLGFDTAFAYVNAQGQSTYKKWKFPSQVQCNGCHKVSSGGHFPNPTDPVLPGRGVLGFYPAQLKKPVTANGVTTDQVLKLFTAGVFTGTPPDAAALANRFVGMHEPIPAGLTAIQRQSLVDKMARSYLASNCSGCHGDRASNGAGGDAVRIPPNFDYFDFAQHNLAFDEIASGSLSDTSSYTDSTIPPFSRQKYQWLVQSSGLSKDAHWKLDLPPGDPNQFTTHVIHVERTAGQVKGYPSLSFGLFRQLARLSPASDSAEWFRKLAIAKENGDAKATATLKWIFAAPWGSKRWLDTLKSHQYNLDSIMAGWEGNKLYRTDGDQMPPLGTSLPDTAALKILGEWVVNQGNITGIKRLTKAKGMTQPWIHQGLLVVPSDWTGPVELLDLKGHAYSLIPLGNGRYALPKQVRAGVMIFRVGSRQFKLSAWK